MFRYYASQQAAMETMIYLYEVKKLRRIGDLLLHYAKGQKIALPARDEFARYAVKMATGSGKRLMFREQSGYKEHVDIIGNSNFMQIVEDLEKTEGIKLDTFEFGKKKTPLKIQTIQVLNDRIAQYDLTIPILTPRLERKKDARAVIESLRLDSLRCDNDFEQDFAHFLDAVPDVKAFANLGNLPAKLSLEYLDSEANLRLYEPDFIGLDEDGTYWILETKGREDIEVARKNLRTEQWCQDVTQLTRQRWQFLLVPQKEYGQLRPGSLGELVAGLSAGGALFV